MGVTITIKNAGARRSGKGMILSITGVITLHDQEQPLDYIKRETKESCLGYCHATSRHHPMDDTATIEVSEMKSRLDRLAAASKVYQFAFTVEASKYT